MKKVFSSLDPARVTLVQSMLETAGIASEMRNEATSQVLPTLMVTPELWVLRDEDCAEAERLISDSGSVAGGDDPARGGQS